MTRWWISFCDSERPEGEQFLGVCIVRAVDPATALKTAWALGINPGGEAAFMDVCDEVAARLPFELPVDVFIPSAAAKALNARIAADLDS